MKRILIAILAVGLIILFCGCNNNSEGHKGEVEKFPLFWTSDKEEKENDSNNPFLFFNGLTTQEDVIDACGKPSVEDALLYYNFELFGTKGTLGFDLVDDDKGRFVAWLYEYPGHVGWKSKDDSRYQASAAEKHAALEYFNNAVDFFTELYGEAMIRDDGDYVWDLSDSLFTRFVWIEFDDDGFSVYYRILR